MTIVVHDQTSVSRYNKWIDDLCEENIKVKRALNLTPTYKSDVFILDESDVLLCKQAVKIH